MTGMYPKSWLALFISPGMFSQGVASAVLLWCCASACWLQSAGGCHLAKSYIVVVCKIVWRRLCHIATLSLMEIELRGMCCDHALLTSLSEPPFKLFLSSSLPVLPILLHCNAACRSDGDAYVLHMT